MVSTVLVIAVVLGIAFLFNELFKKLNLPPVVGQIVGGLLLGINVLRELIFMSSKASKSLICWLFWESFFCCILLGLKSILRRFDRVPKRRVKFFKCGYCASASRQNCYSFS